MRRRLMNKNTLVMAINYNHILTKIEEIYEINNINYTPLSVFNTYNNESRNVLKVLNEWFKDKDRFITRKYVW